VSTAVRRALYGKLAGDNTLTGILGTPAAGYTQSIYYQEAPAGAGFPFVVISKQSGVPTEALADPSAYENDVWMIKGVDRGTSADTAESIQARVQTLLNDATLSISGATHLYLRRQSDLDFSEVANGVTYRHSGSLYRLVYDPT
jgi:hypothetical protein